MLVTIEKLDHYGRGVTHLNGKVIFVENALPNEIVDIEVIESKKKFSVAKVRFYQKKSKERIKSVCPYFEKCGGCSLMFYPYEKTLEFKKNKSEELFRKNNIVYSKEIEVIKNEQPFFYRNKISLKIKDGKVGYYQKESHELVEIKECIVASKEMNQVIQNIHLLHIKDGNLTIRCNQNKEILLVIETKEPNKIEILKLKEIVKLVGIVYNQKVIYGDSFLYERIGGKLFKISFDSFFQVNPYICTKLFALIEKEIDKNSTVLDLYSGVGTLSIVASERAKEVISVEIIKNAVLNGILNAKLNQKDNIQFLLGDVSKTVDKINKEFDTFIVDPPRAGLDKNTISFIKKKLPKKMIYVSCDIHTLIRDVQLLNEYEIKEYKILDMFSYSYHLENFMVLERKEGK